jgi:SET domain-containing protein
LIKIRTIRYRVGRSRIHGRGAFATCKIRKGTRVVEYTGERIPARLANRHAARSNHVWLFDLEDGTFIDGDQQSPGACVNHSCEPNCFTEIDGTQVFIVAERTIQPGEELTYDYRFSPDEEIHPCACGAARCRGTINLRPRRKARRSSTGPSRGRQGSSKKGATGRGRRAS